MTLLSWDLGSSLESEGNRKSGGAACVLKGGWTHVRGQWLGPVPPRPQHESGTPRLEHVEQTELGVSSSLPWKVTSPVSPKAGSQSQGS